MNFFFVGSYLLIAKFSRSLVTLGPRAFARRLGVLAHGPLCALSPVGLLVAIAEPFKNNAVQRFSRGAGSGSAVSCRNIPFGRPLLVGGCMASVGPVVDGGQRSNQLVGSGWARSSRRCSSRWGRRPSASALGSRGSNRLGRGSLDRCRADLGLLHGRRSS